MSKLYFAAKAIIQDGDKFLILKRTQEENDIWEIPGGRMEFGESLENTLHREVKEETNLEIIPKRIINSWDLIEDLRQISGVIYLCKIKSGELQLSHEHKDFQWITTDDLNKLYPVFSTRLASLELQ
jgi:8-oxo-dGTP diphosphatase